MERNESTLWEELDALHAEYANACGYVEFLAGKAGEYGLWENFGTRLSEMYLRLKQGPVRVVVMGQTSSGKSTLINAFAGDFIAPEAVGVCSPVPIWLMHHQIDGIYVDRYRQDSSGLPVLEVSDPGRLIAQRYGEKARDNLDDGSWSFVYVNR